MTRPHARRAVRRVWLRVEAGPAGPVASGVRLVGRRGRRRLGRMLVRLATAIGGQDVLNLGGTGVARSSWRGIPRSWHIKPAPRPVDGPWPTPPPVDEPMSIARSIYRTGERPQVMDVTLLEALNEEYRSRPLVPAPPTYGQEDVEGRAQHRLLGVHNRIDLHGKRVLELGCGAGFEVWYLSHHFGSEAWGVDVAERMSWPFLGDERTHYVCADIGAASPFEAGYFDRVISFTVLEHVVHPHAVLSDIYRILRPGGLAYLSANLYRGPKASHLYRELFFPFPHLLFDDDVIRQYRERHSGESAGAYWVNRLTWAQYEDYFNGIGFTIRSLRFGETPLDESIYQRFSDILGRYPRWDLERDFFHVVLEKPRGG